MKLNEYSFRLVLHTHTHIHIVKDPPISSLHFSRHLMQITEDWSYNPPVLNTHLGIWHRAEDHPYCQYFYYCHILVDISKTGLPENHENHLISFLQWLWGDPQIRQIGIFEWLLLQWWYIVMLTANVHNTFWMKNSLSLKFKGSTNSNLNTWTLNNSKAPRHEK
jgi:hypothetical protein